jgi:hypothetical protein
MKIFEIGIDANGRSTPGLIDVPLKKISDTEAISEPQPGAYWRVGLRFKGEHTRAEPDYDPRGGTYEQHLGGQPHIIAWMSGHMDNIMQNGDTWRFCTGDLLYVRPGSLHHSNLRSTVLPTVFNLYLPGEDTDVGPLEIKK